MDEVLVHVRSFETMLLIHCPHDLCKSLVLDFVQVQDGEPPCFPFFSHSPRGPSSEAEFLAKMALL